MLPSASPALYSSTTHLFADFSMLKPGDFMVDLSEAASMGVQCLKAEYIADYLMQVSTVRVHSRLIAYLNEYIHLQH